MSISDRLSSRFSNRHEQRLRPHPGPVPPRSERSLASGGKSGALRAAIFGINDGLLSNLSLIMGVAVSGIELSRAIPPAEPIAAMPHLRSPARKPGVTRLAH